MKKIGLIDGPVNSLHHDFDGIDITSIGKGKSSFCLSKDSPACVHGTFIAGILVARKGSLAPGVCLQMPLISRPLFCEASDLRQCPIVTPNDLAKAVIDVVDAGARVLNLSLGIVKTGLGKDADLHQAFDYAKSHDVIVVGASGNQGRIGHNPLFDHPWVIPAAACDSNGKLLPGSNIGKSIGQRGLLAPGKDIISTYSNGGYTKLSGTSMAVAFVAGNIAKLWSEFPDVSGKEIRDAILITGKRRTSVVPPILDFSKSQSLLKSKLTYTA